MCKSYNKLDELDLAHRKLIVIMLSKHLGISELCHTFPPLLLLTFSNNIINKIFTFVTIRDTKIGAKGSKLGVLDGLASF
jgi:hypothetical protein